MPNFSREKPCDRPLLLGQFVTRFLESRSVSPARWRWAIRIVNCAAISFRGREKIFRDGRALEIGQGLPSMDHAGG